MRWLPLFALVACSSAQPVARNATATTATVSVAPVAPPPTVIQAPAMTRPPPPPPAKRVLGPSDRIPIADVVKAVTPNRRVVVYGPRNVELLAELKKDGFTGFLDWLPKTWGGYHEESWEPHDVVVADIDGDDEPLIQRSPAYGRERSPVIVRWRHRMGKSLFLEDGYVDARCREAVCDAFTIYGGALPRESRDFSDLPLVEMMPWNGRPRPQ